MKGREIIKRTVVSLDEAADIGRVDNVVFDRQARIAGLVIKRRGGQEELGATAIANVHAFGPDAITLEQTAGVEGAPRVEEMQDLPSLRQLVGCRVITDGGTYLGTVRDLLIDPEERRITDFELVARGLLGRLRGDVIPAAGHLRFGRELVIVPNAVAIKGRAVLEQIDQTSPPPTAVGDFRPIGLARAAEHAGASRVAGREQDSEEEGLARALGG